jgi:rhodanese-related sulfurtransferase
MPTYRELLQQLRGEIAEIDASGARRLDGALFVDVREQDEWDEGHITGAVHVSRGHLESRIEAAAPDKSQPLVVYCQSGNRSVFATKALEELGYENVVNLAGGYVDWKRNGFPTQLPRSLAPEQRSRYSRHLLIPEVGVEGQLKLLQSRVLLIGAGGLGSPSPRPASARSASSTTTASTPRTCSARSRTRPRRSASGRSTRRSGRSRPSIRTSTSSPTRSG